jgi:predicted DNA-binding transcriptional regulator YafY
MIERGSPDYAVEVLFDPKAADRVEDYRWHSTQDLERRPDGSLLFRATVSGLTEVARWILSWGPQARVLRPQALVHEVSRLARETLERYG